METIMELKNDRKITVEKIYNKDKDVEVISIKIFKRSIVNPWVVENELIVGRCDKYEEIMSFLTILVIKTMTSKLINRVALNYDNIIEGLLEDIRNTKICIGLEKLFLDRILHLIDYKQPTGTNDTPDEVLPYLITMVCIDTRFKIIDEIIDICGNTNNISILFKSILDNMTGKILINNICCIAFNNTKNVLLYHITNDKLREMHCVILDSDKIKIYAIAYAFSCLLQSDRDNALELFKWFKNSNFSRKNKEILKLIYGDYIYDDNIFFNINIDIGIDVAWIMSYANSFASCRCSGTSDNIYILRDIDNKDNLIKLIDVLFPNDENNNIKVDSRINNTNKELVSEEKPKCPKERVSFDEYFLNIAEVVGTRATCIRRQYGAVITKGNKIISTGYNGSPRNSENCIDIGSCIREEKNIPKGSNYELCKSVHAEQNAIIQGNPESMEGATIYIVGKEVSDGSYANGAPCLICNRMIKNAGIRRVVHRDKNGECVSFFI